MTKKLKKVIITAAGTGGHITPGLAVAKQLRKQDVEVLWIGGKRKIEQTMVEGEDFIFQRLNFCSFRTGSILSRLLFPFKFIFSIIKVMQIMLSFKPNAIIGFGGYTTGVVGLASFLLRKPLYIQEQNARAGMTNRYLSKISRIVFAAFENAFTQKESKNNIKVIGNPVPEELSQIHEKNIKSRLCKTSTAMNILVLGGSQGAMFLNKNLANIFYNLSKQTAISVKHQCGSKNIESTKQHYSSHEKSDNFSFDILPFISDMQAAYKWADCIICRAGALAISEVAAVGLPSILIPFPHASDNHQLYNAQYLEGKNAAYVMQQKDFNPVQLTDWLLGWAQHPNTLSQMAQAASAAARRNATKELISSVEKDL